MVLYLKSRSNSSQRIQIMNHINSFSVVFKTLHPTWAWSQEWRLVTTPALRWVTKCDPSKGSRRTGFCADDCRDNDHSFPENRHSTSIRESWDHSECYHVGQVANQKLILYIYIYSIDFTSLGLPTLQIVSGIVHVFRNGWWFFLVQ